MENARLPFTVNRDNNGNFSNLNVLHLTQCRSPKRLEQGKCVSAAPAHGVLLLPGFDCYYTTLRLPGLPLRSMLVGVQFRATPADLVTVKRINDTDSGPPV
jgi:hypothetical protein